MNIPGLSALLFAAFSPTATFHKDVEPILQAKCQGCHRPGEAAPMALVNYREVRPWAKAIKQAVATRSMPPWHADPSVGRFKNDRRLSDSEIAAIVAWADGGAPEGDAADAPKPAEFTEGWALGKPDLVVEMPKPFEVPAKGVLDYQWIVIPGFTEEKWIEAFEVRPGDRSVVHHLAVFWRRAGSKWMSNAVPGVAVAKPSGAPEQGQSDGILAEYGPGIPPVQLPSGYAFRLPARADLVLQLHYTPNGKASLDQTRIGLFLAKERPRYQVITTAMGGNVSIRPYDANYRGQASLTLAVPVRILGMNPHMHLRGKSAELRAYFPDGCPRTLLRVPRYDFNWQTTYEPANELRIPAETRLETTFTFDNSPNNPSNPDPSRHVKSGDQTTDEMMVLYLHVAIPARMDPSQLYARQPYPAKPATR